ncbi:MAG: M20 family metallopeptidase [Candidatus Heimdallarchaeota archaeon]|nr:MAG: M20 family metallopeptidase [Candidatus Heimdallarchaeota archaeon]
MNLSRDSSECLHLLKELIKLNSENPPGNTQLPIEFIQNWAEINEIPVKTQWYKEKQANIVLSVGKTRKSIVMCGHLDTVPAGDLENWNCSPVGAEERNGYIYGRGSADMKGGVSTCLGALKLVNDSVDIDTMKYQIVFLGTSDEEVGLGGAKAALQLGIMNNADFLIVAEPTNLKVGIAEKGVLWITIRSYGKSAHGSTPEKGVNAIEELVKLFPLLKEVPQISHPILGQSTLNIGTIKGGKSTNVVPENAEVNCDFRLVPPINITDFAKDLSNKIDEMAKSSPAEFETEIKQIMLPVSNSQENRFIQDFMKVSNNSTPIGLNYGTDAAVLVTQAPTPVPFVLYGPGDPKAIHCANERVSIMEVLQAESVLTRFLKNSVIPSTID